MDPIDFENIKEEIVLNKTCPICGKTLSIILIK